MYLIFTLIVLIFIFANTASYRGHGHLVLAEISLTDKKINSVVGVARF